MPDLDGAVIDAPLLDDLNDGQVDDGSDDDGAGAGGVDDAAAATGADDAAAAAGDAKQDERVLPQWIRNLKQTDPAAFKEAKGIFFGKRSIDDKLKDFDLDGTKSFLDEHGGRESLATSLTEMQQAKAELESLREQAANGDRRVIEALAASPEGFAKLAPAMAEKWAQMDPEGWDHAMSGVFNATIQQSGVPMHLERMGLQMEQFRFALESNPQLQQNPQLMAVFNTLSQQVGQLKGWTGSFAEKAGKALQRQGGQQGASKVDQREQALNERESQMYNSDIETASESARMPLIASELAAYIARRPNDAEAKELAIANVRTEVIKRLNADKDFVKKVQAFHAKRDKEGALRLIKSRETAAIQEIAPKIGRTIFGNPGAAKSAVKSAAVQRPAARVAQQADVDPKDAILRRAFGR